MTSDFFEGPVSQDFHDIVDSAAVMAAAATKKKHGGKKAAKTKICGETDHTKAPPCSVTDVCRSKKKSSAFVPELPGWSSPAAPPSI